MKPFALWVGSVLLVAAPAWAETGPHGGTVVSDQNSVVEYRVNPKTRKIDAYILKGPKPSSSKMSAKLLKRSGPPETVELNLMSSADTLGGDTATQAANEDAPRPAAAQPHFAGSFGPGGQSFVGIEIRIPVGGQTRVLRSSDPAEADAQGPRH